MSDFPWEQFVILYGLGLLGAAAIMPYAFALNAERLKEAPLTRPQLIAVSFLQSGILVAIVTAVGLLVGRDIGLGAPLLERLLDGEPVGDVLGGVIPLSVAAGAGAVALMVTLEFGYFSARMPEAFRSKSGELALWKRFLAGIYGGVTEELLTRLFLLSAVAWTLGQVWQGPNGTPADGAMVVATLGAAILFGVGHLPAAKALAPLTPLVVFRTILLNAIGGIAFGLLYWQEGLLAAMIAHFCADMGLHIVAPMFVKPADDAGPDLPAAPVGVEGQAQAS